MVEYENMKKRDEMVMVDDEMVMVDDEMVVDGETGGSKKMN